MLAGFFSKPITFGFLAEVPWGALETQPVMFLQGTVLTKSSGAFIFVRGTLAGYSPSREVVSHAMIAEDFRAAPSGCGEAADETEHFAKRSSPYAWPPVAEIVFGTPRCYT